MSELQAFLRGEDFILVNDPVSLFRSFLILGFFVNECQCFNKVPVELHRHFG